MSYKQSHFFSIFAPFVLSPVPPVPQVPSHRVPRVPRDVPHGQAVPQQSPGVRGVRTPRRVRRGEGGEADEAPGAACVGQNVFLASARSKDTTQARQLLLLTALGAMNGYFLSFFFVSSWAEHYQFGARECGLNFSPDRILRSIFISCSASRESGILD